MTYKALFTSILFAAFSTQILAVNNTEQHCLAVHNQVVADYLNISVEQLSSRTLGAACKVDPANNTETLLSYAVLEPKFTKDNYQADQNNIPNWEHFVMRIKDGVVLQSWKTEEVIDASMDVNENSFKIDTAPYILNKDVRAFGVRFKNAARGPSAPDYSSDDVLTLFVADEKNKKLNIVFSYPMHIWY